MSGLMLVAVLASTPAAPPGPMPEAARAAGFTESESSVGVTLRRVFASQSGKRLVVACFASHMHRVQQIIDAAVANGRKVATLGRSMGKNVELGSRLGIISIPDFVISTGGGTPASGVLQARRRPGWRLWG